MTRSRLLLLLVLGLLSPGLFIQCNSNSERVLWVRSNPRIAELISKIENDSIVYLEVINSSESPIATGEKGLIFRVVISGVGCSTCFEDLVNVLNSYADLKSDNMLCLVITNPDRSSAFQLKRMHDINVPLYITGDTTLRAIGEEMGSAYIFSEDQLNRIKNLRPINSAEDIITYIESASLPD